MTHDDGRLKIYEQCFSEKRHYDGLSWTIGAGLAVIVGVILTTALHTPLEQVFSRFLLAALALAFLLLWRTLYHRNRFWGEVANEKARDIEKDLGLDGLGHALMRSSLDGYVTLKNTDVDGTSHGEYSPRKETSPSLPLHMIIDLALICCAAIILAIPLLGLCLKDSP